MGYQPKVLEACVADHVGPYGITEDVMRQSFDAWQAGRLPTRERRGDEMLEAQYDEGVAVIQLHGPSFKLRSKFGGYSNNEAANLLSDVFRSDAIHSVLLDIDSPGGQVAGAYEVADAIFNGRKKRRVHAHIRNLGASNGFLVASQCDSISMDRSGSAGAMGAFLLLHDLSAKAEKNGERIILISTGDLKGKGAPGLPVGPEVVAEYQRLVDHAGNLFVEAVARGRGIDETLARSWMTGKLFHGKEAVEAGLVDAIAPFSAVLDDLKAGRQVKGS